MTLQKPKQKAQLHISNKLLLVYSKNIPAEICLDTQNTLSIVVKKDSQHKINFTMEEPPILSWSHILNP